MRAPTRVESRSYGQRFEVAPGIEAVFRRAGHILGSASVEVALEVAGRRLCARRFARAWGGTA